MKLPEADLSDEEFYSYEKKFKCPFQMNIKQKDKIDLVLINPGDSKQVYQKLGSSLSAIEPPIWAGLIGTFIRKQGYNVFILDANAEGMGPVDVAERIVEIDPVLTAVVAYGQNPCGTTWVMPAAGAICKEIKRLSPEKKILMVGGHVAALPERTLREESVDFVCDGEGPLHCAGTAYGFEVFIPFL